MKDFFEDKQIKSKDFFEEVKEQPPTKDFFATPKEKEVSKPSEPKVSPLATAYLAQVKAFTPEGLRGIEKGVKSQLSGATLAVSELIPGMKPEQPKDEKEQTLQSANRFIGSMLPWGAFEKYVVGPIGEKVAWQVAKNRMGIIKPLLAKLGTKMAVRGIASPAINTLESIIRNGEAPSKKELLKHGAWTAALGGAFDAFAEIGIPLHQALRNIAKQEGSSVWNQYKRFGSALKNKGYSFFKGEGKPVTPETLKETGIEFAEKVKYPTEEIQAIDLKPTEVEVLPKTEIAKPTEIIPPKPPIPPIKPSGEDPASPDNITEATSNAFNKTVTKLDVEAPFKKIGANETGFAVKNYFDQINMHIEQGDHVSNQIKKLKLSPEQLNNVVLQSELAKPPKDLNERKAWLMMRSYFDESLTSLKKYGVLKKGFHERIASNILAKIKALDDIIKLSSGKNKLKYIQEAKDLHEQLKDISKLRFVSIPVRSLFDTKMKADPALTKRAIKFLNKKQRKTITLQDLVDSGLIDKKDLTPEMVINNYSRKYGRDIALAKIIQAAKKEGLATLEPKEGYVKIPGYVAPELSKYYINPVFADFIEGYTNPKHFSPWEKLCSMMKGYSFYNPTILACNNIQQQLWATLGMPQTLHKLAPAYKQAVLDIKNKTANYWEAYDNGIFSSPFVEFDKTLKEFTKTTEKEGPNLLLNILKKIGKFPIKLHEKFYNALQTQGWLYGDKLIRMATYNYYRSIGMNPRDAAQETAKKHGDYASVPPKTRRMLNKTIYTPTFQIVMGKAFVQMAKGIKNVTASIFKGEKINPKDKARASGILAIGLILGTVHTIMKSKDYDTVVPGLDYKKDIIDEEGNKKTIHVGFSWAFMSFIRYFKVLSKSVAPGVENRLLTFMRGLKSRSAVPIQIFWELAENKRRNWKNVYEPYAPHHKQLYDVFTYLVKRIFPLVGTPLGEKFGDQEEQKKVNKELGAVATNLPFMFPYITDRTDAINARKAKYLSRKMKTLIKKGKISDKEIDQYLKEIDRLWKTD